MVVRVGKKELRPIKHTTVFDLLKKEKRMRVRMLRDLDAAFDGITVQRLKAGESYDVPESQAKGWLDKEIAAEDKALDPPVEMKVKRATKKTIRRKPKR